MSDEEEYEEEEIEEEEEVEEDAEGEAAAEPEPAAPAPKEEEESHEAPKEEERKLRPPPPREEEKAPEEMTEAEAAIAAARKRKEEEDAHKLLDYEQQRVIEKQKIEEELRELREKQQRRRQEREQEEREFAQRAKEAEERRRQEEEQHKQRVEEEKRKRDEEKNKRQQMIAGSLLGGVAAGGGPNFTVQKGSGVPGQPGEEGKKSKRGPTPEQIAAAKKQYIETISRKPDLSNILPNDLKILIKRMATRIDRIIGETYDLQQRSGRQEYDVKELQDRQLQAQRNKALKMGIDPSEAGDLKHPPKVNVASKFDRQTDRRGYGDRRTLFENPFEEPQKSIAHGTGRPPIDWGRKKGTGLMDEIEQIRKNLEPPKYIEQAPVEGAKPPVEPRPLEIPAEDYAPAPAKEEAAEDEAPQEVEAEA